MTLIFRRLILPALVLLSACSDAPTSVVRTDRQPILFIHGFGGSLDDWAPVLARFKADGWTDRELIAKTYGMSGNASIAATISDDVTAALAATGWDRVTIISFSMGSLSSRHYIRNLGGTDIVEAWVSISGPNHGTTTAEQCLPLKACQEMLPGSPFLEALNAGDETPGAVRYATWWSPCDQLVNPPESTILDGANNTETACLPHTGMFTEGIYLQVKAFITS